jgi:hypothetical protein
MSTKSTLLYKESDGGRNYLHIFEETLTPPPYRIDFEVMFDGIEVRGEVNQEFLDLLIKEGTIKRSRF